VIKCNCKMLNCTLIAIDKQHNEGDVVANYGKYKIISKYKT